MSSSDRRKLLALLAGLPLAACGFAPVYAPGAPATALRGAILPDDPANRLAYAFVARFEERLGRATAPQWALGYRIGRSEVAVGLSPDNVTTRYHVNGTLDWSLRPAGSDEPAMSGRLTAMVAYSATATTVATLAARRDADERLAAMLADQLVTTLISRAGELGA